VNKTALLISLLLLPQTLLANDYSYETISKRYPSVKMEKKVVTIAKMEGECLAGLKNLNFKRKMNLMPLRNGLTTVLSHSCNIIHPAQY